MSDKPVLSTTGHLMSVDVMRGLIWGGFALCFLAFSLRAWIRYVCFRRLLVEDYLMVLVLGILLGSAIVSQLRLPYVYIMLDVGNGAIPVPPPTIMDDIRKAMDGVFVNTVLCIVGIYAVKLNFLLFFYRLGKGITQYLAFWWIVLVITVGCFGTTWAFMEYKCTLGDAIVIATECTTRADTARLWRNFILACSLDAFTDVLILCFPISILWGVRVPVRKKIILGCVFSMTIFTVAVTIIRGTIQHGRVAADFSQSQNIAWVWFWTVLETDTAYLIACLVTFRSLFARNDNKPRDRQPPRPVPGPRSRSARRRDLVDSLLDTFRDWEGVSDRQNGDLSESSSPSGGMSGDLVGSSESKKQPGVSEEPQP
ncbi:hypothetical protein V8F20_001240 [Naviculisporaceae sp. PSN 640]